MDEGTFKILKSDITWKMDWGIGPWREEPDRVEFFHKGIHCLINRKRLGCLCGYVLIDSDVKIDASDLDVHGGVTCDEIVEEERVIGFDCAHSEDYIPGMGADINIEKFFCCESDYKSLTFCILEVEELANQVVSQLENN